MFARSPDPSAATAISCSPARVIVSGVFRTDPGWHRTRVHLNIDPGQRALSADLDGVLNFEQRAPRFEGALTLAAPAKARGATATPWRVTSKVKADRAAARLDLIEASYGPKRGP